MLKIRRPLGRLIFNMGITIPGKTVFLIETAHCLLPHHVSFEIQTIARKTAVCHENIIVDALSITWTANKYGEHMIFIRHSGKILKIQSHDTDNMLIYPIHFYNAVDNKQAFIINTVKHILIIMSVV